MRFKIADKVYEASSVDRLSMGHLLRIESETEAVGCRMTWAEVQALLEELAGIAEAEAENHPAALFVIGLTVWASRLNAGETVTLAEAVDFPLGDLQWLPEPGDHKEPKNPTQRPPKATGAAGKRPPAKAK